MTKHIPPYVLLRPLILADAEVFASWSEDLQFCRDADWSLDLSREQHLAFWENLVAMPPDNLIRLAAMWEDEIIGYIHLHGTEVLRRELGFVIGPSSNWGRGFSRAAAALALRFGFQDLGLVEIWAEALALNGRSVAILRYLGMRETGRGENGTFRGQPTFYRRFAASAP